LNGMGIVSFGAYVPQLRLSRQVIVQANGWFNDSLRGLAKGERSVCNWDEDAVTMAVEAARDCLESVDRARVADLTLASTTLPFADRQNAGIVAAALNVPENIATSDSTSSQRAATTALLRALRSQPSDTLTLVVASEKRRAKTASSQELLFGDGAAALLVGGDNPVASLVAAHQITVDFADHYRGEGESFDYNWEERWIRDEGYRRIVPRALANLFNKADLAPDKVDRFIMPATIARVPQDIAKQAGIRLAAVADTLANVMGNSGAAHPLVLLVNALERAKAGETILLVGFGQGCDALLFKVTDAIGRLSPRRGVAGSLARRRPETNYQRYLAFNDLVTMERGIRSELDKQTAVSALYRNRKTVLGFVGGKCRECGTVQFPKSNVCVNPNCGRVRSQDDHPLADAAARIQSCTADHLTYTPDPPQHFGMIVFEDGGRLMADITDVGKGELDVGVPVKMMFRVKDYDERRGFRRYFWKAVPSRPAAIEIAGASDG
jgi:hydroxymethylglutaryl-CoA synthase